MDNLENKLSVPSLNHITCTLIPKSYVKVEIRIMIIR